MSLMIPSKRPGDTSVVLANGKGKRRKFSKEFLDKSSTECITARVLCPASSIDAFTGDSDGTIRQIMDDSGAVVSVQESVPGCDERVIVITVNNTEEELASKLTNGDAAENEGADTETKGKEDGGETEGADGETKGDDGGAKDDDGETKGDDGQTTNEDGEAKDNDQCDMDKEGTENNEDEESVHVEILRYERMVSCVRKALFFIFDKLVESEVKTGNDAGDEDVNKSSFVFRLLVPSSEVECLVEKDGRIEEMTIISGAQILMLPRDDLPVCALPSDEVIQIAGDTDAVRKGLELFSGELIGNRPLVHDTSPIKSSGTSSHSTSHSVPQSQANLSSFHSFNAHNDPRNGSYRSGRSGHLKDSLVTGQLNPPLAMLSFRLLCDGERVGSVIGKGGTVVKAVQQETSSEIKVLDGVPDSEDRIIVVSGPAHPDDQISPVQDAVVRVQKRILGANLDSKEASVPARLLVSSNQIGCLLGVGGAVIAEMRKSTKAYIRILGKDHVPKCALANEEVVQINGDNKEIQDALLQITTRLRHHFFRFIFPLMDHPLNPHFLDPVSPFPSYVGRREISPPGIYPTFGPSARKFDMVDGPHGAFHHLDDRPFMQSTFRPSLSGHLPERGPWNQGPIDSGSFMDIPDFARGLPRRLPGFGGGSQPAIITSTTVEVVVPRSIVPAIKGEGGGCLKQIRQFSDARITIRESKPGEKEAAIIISGTPEQTQAAQSLIQAFVMIEQESN